VLDLQAVAQGVADVVVLDQPGDEGVRAVGIAEIHAGAHPLDAIAAHHPAEGRTLAGNADALLGGGMVVDVQVFQGDMVGVAGVALGLDGVHRQVAAIKLEMAQDHVPNVGQADRVGARAGDEAGARAVAGAFDDDGRVGAPFQVLQGQTAPIVAAAKQQAIPGRQPGQIGAVILGPGLKVGGLDRAGQASPQEAGERKRPPPSLKPGGGAPIAGRFGNVALPSPALPVNGAGESPSPARGGGWEGERGAYPREKLAAPGQCGEAITRLPGHP
jgi:hypothetical protein